MAGLPKKAGTEHGLIILGSEPRSSFLSRITRLIGLGYLMAIQWRTRLWVEDM